jgi:PhnB protein
MVFPASNMLAQRRTRGQSQAERLLLQIVHRAFTEAAAQDVDTQRILAAISFASTRPVSRPDRFTRYPQNAKEQTMSNAVNFKPAQYRSLTPNLVSNNAQGAIDFYKKIFGATVNVHMPGPGGKMMHAELRIGDSTFFINDTMNAAGIRGAEPGRSNPMYLHLYVEDVDAVYNAALAAGARSDMPVQDMFWGDRYGKLTDPFGQQWGIATHTEDVSPEEMQARMKAMSQQAAGHSA